MTRAQTQQALRQLPLKWALGFLALIVVYALAQPALNSRFGLHLPSLASLMGEPEPKPQADAAKDRLSKANSGKSNQQRTSQTNAEIGDAPTASPATLDSPPADTPTASIPSANGPTTQKTTNKPSSSAKPARDEAAPNRTTQVATQELTPTAKANKSASNENSDLLYGILKETSPNRYVSVEGLQYNPGSEEQHRLKHLERHLSDISDRPGKHGVFNGEMKDVLKVIDEAYARGKRGAKGVRKSQEDNRTIYEVPFSQPIGYIGGRDGKRDGHPPARRLRLVVEGTKFITAFPF